MKFMAQSKNKEVLVVGAGAAGLMAAITAAEQGARVTLLERNEKVGRKIYITGKGRCNLTNLCEVRSFLQAVPRGAKFLNSALYNFTPEDTMAWFEAHGVPLKVERGNRVFPTSDKSSDVIDALFMSVRRLGVTLVQAQALELILEANQLRGVSTDKGRFFSDTVILATGGLSYPNTGSTGDGYAFAQQAGHTIVPCAPSLVPFTSPDSVCREMQGLSLRNVTLSITCKDKTVYSEMGELLFTHFGLSGPLVLSASAIVEDFSQCVAHINSKPALSAQQLDERILREIDAQKNRSMSNLAATMLPRLMIAPVLQRAAIAPETKAHSLTREQRGALVAVMQDFQLPLSGTRAFEEAVVTRGGVACNEVNPKTMESKLCKGLFVAGEMLDIDALTGGYNLQIAWSTGYAAGRYASEENMDDV